tara:strand:- start:499 stop:795 length:297 start_codon:yes stop_codon:yes gene_type:complete
MFIYIHTNNKVGGVKNMTINTQEPMEVLPNGHRKHTLEVMPEFQHTQIGALKNAHQLWAELSGGLDSDVVMKKAKELGIPFAELDYIYGCDEDEYNKA